VRFPLPRFLVALTLLISSPMVVGGGCAQAGYVAPVALVRCLHANWGTEGWRGAVLIELGSAWTSSDFGYEIDLSGNGGSGLAPSPWRRYSIALHCSFSLPGAGSQGSSGAGGSYQAPTLLAFPPHADTAVLVGLHFLEVVWRRPPPFSSRLFRPPRLSRMVVS